MIVPDASVVVVVVLRMPGAPSIEHRIQDFRETLHAPHLIDAESAHVIRRAAANREIAAERGQAAIEDLVDFPLRRHPHLPLLLRIWELRHNLSAYDAAYVALAEALDAPLVTRDRRLAASSGHRAKIEVF